MTVLDDAAYLTWLKQECGYRDPRPLREGWWVAIMPLMFTHAIITGRMGNRLGYEDRWCYASYKAAKAAMDAWDGTGEPTGWHRHPDTGRRKDETGREYVDP